LNPQKKAFQYSYRLYLNFSGKRVLGKGGAQILEAIDECGSIAGAAEKLGMSYRFVWNYITRMRRILKEPVVLTRRGGIGHHKRRGGGGAELTARARSLLKEYRSTEGLVKRALRSKNRRSLNR
jgi:molybdate transport system regulatory protein